MTGRWLGAACTAALALCSMAGAGSRVLRGAGTISNGAGQWNQMTIKAVVQQTRIIHSKGTNT